MTDKTKVIPYIDEISKVIPYIDEIYFVDSCIFFFFFFFFSNFYFLKIAQALEIFFFIAFLLGLNWCMSSLTVNPLILSGSEDLRARL